MRILPFRDKPFVKCDEAVQAVREIIYELRPELLIAQSPYINTKGHFGRQGLATIQEDDHTECAITTLEAARLASLPDYEAAESPHEIAMTLYPSVYFEQDQVDFWVDITEWKPQRVAAELAFASQGQRRSGPRSASRSRPATTAGTRARVTPKGSCGTGRSS